MQCLPPTSVDISWCIIDAGLTLWCRKLTLTCRFCQRDPKLFIALRTFNCITDNMARKEFTKNILARSENEYCWRVSFFKWVRNLHIEYAWPRFKKCLCKKAYPLPIHRLSSRLVRPSSLTLWFFQYPLLFWFVLFLIPPQVEVQNRAKKIIIYYYFPR